MNSKSIQLTSEALEMMIAKRSHDVDSVEWDIKMRESTIASTKSAGAKTRAQNEVNVLQLRLTEKREDLADATTALVEFNEAHR